MSNILITGSRHGLGAELHKALYNSGHDIIPYDKEDRMDVRRPRALPEQLDVLINNAGVNDIDWLENFSEERWDEIMNTNAKGIFLMTKACMPMLKESKGTVVNIVSNAAHVPMTCSLAYNASKAAAHIMTKQLARELRGKVTVFGVAPNRMSGTDMSSNIDEQVVDTRGWTHEEARKYQLASLLAGAETPPSMVADFIAYLLSTKSRHQYLTGCVLPYGA